MALAATAWCSVVKAGERDTMNNARVLAHYMPWFKAEPVEGGGMAWDHWQWFGKGRKHDPDDWRDATHRDIASVYYPLIGPYDSRRPEVIEYHVLTAQAAGIDGFVADWYGPHDFTDEAFARLLSCAERLHFKAAICLEEKTFFPGYAAVTSRADVLDGAVRLIDYVVHTYAASSAYLNQGPRAVLFVFNGHEEGTLGQHWLSSDEWAAVLNRAGRDRVLLVRGQAEAAYADAVPGGYGWCGDATYRQSFYATGKTLRAEHRLSYLVGPACPGFDDSGVNGWGRGTRFDDRRGTAAYEEAWRDALAAMPDAVQIVTWNDFQEGTTIEPAEEYGFGFVDLTEQMVQQYTGRKARLDDNRWPHRLYKLRASVAALPSAVDRETWTRKLDGFADDMSHGKRWFMNWRLKSMEARLRSESVSH